ncbi:MAG: restriction endonuclease [Bdellovibrionales bacterium]|nr:restriction endonuclease [Bdellovibrionales bacterium]
MRFCHNIFIHFSFLFIPSFYSVASPCIGALNSKPAELRSLSLEYSAGAVKDFLGVPFPRLKYKEARAIHSSEVKEIVSRYYDYVFVFNQFSQTLKDEERQILAPAFRIFMDRIDSFVSQYGPFESTSSILNRLNTLSNQLKGIAFERMIAVLLLRMGYSTVTIDESAKRKILNAIYGKKKLDIEIDVIATKDGLTYLVEAKSIKPLGNEHLAMQIKAVSRQMTSRKMRLPLNNHVRNIVIAHFNVGEDVRAEWLEAGADEVYYIRRNYLDDIDLY